MKPQKLKEVRRGKHYYLEEEIFQRLDWKEQGCPRTLGNRMGLKELAISKAPENEWRARSIWETEKEQKVNQRFLENEYYFWLVVIIFPFWRFFIQ